MNSKKQVPSKNKNIANRNNNAGNESTNTITVIPTVLANNKQEFDERLSRLLPTSKTLQIDFMDGQFVPSKGIDIEDIPDLTRWKAWTFEAHLMMYHPDTWFEEVAKKGFKRVIFHYEAVEDKNISTLAQQIRDLGMMPILAINPDTPPLRIIKYTKFVDGVLFLGVHPGFNGAPYVTTTPQRIEDLIIQLKEHQEDKTKQDKKIKKQSTTKNTIFIQVDGGMNPDTINGVVHAGATRINSGSYVSNAPDPAQAISTLYVAANSKEPKTTTVQTNNKKVAIKKNKIQKSLDNISNKIKKVITKKSKTKKLKK